MNLCAPYAVLSLAKNAITPRLLKNLANKMTPFDAWKDVMTRLRKISSFVYWL